MDTGIAIDLAAVAGIIGSVVGTGAVVGIALAVMAWRITGRLDRRMDRFDDAMARWQERFDVATAEHRADMRRLAERQSHVEGRFDERGSAAD